MPEPVGAQISAFAPPEIASQPPACAGVGPSKEASNHFRTGAEKPSIGAFSVADVLMANLVTIATATDRPGRTMSQSAAYRPKQDYGLLDVLLSTGSSASRQPGERPGLHSDLGRALSATGARGNGPPEDLVVGRADCLRPGEVDREGSTHDLVDRGRIRLAIAAIWYE